LASYFPTRNMSWSNHTHSIATKARQKLGFLRRNPKGSPLDCKKLANVALVKSSQVFVYLTGMSECRPVHRTIEYASIIWDPYLQKDVDSLERVQQKATRWVTSTYDKKSSVSRLMRELQWETLHERRRTQRLTFMYKILNGEVAVPAELIDLELSACTSRGDYNQQKLYKPRTHTTEYQKSFEHRTIPEWNSLPSFLSCSVRHSIYLQVSALRSSVERNHPSL